ncbi:hypothetical protein FBU59_002220 [Linderina macrospora]|uniref:Uncharacterized protein n=1 Tax=Linderina macrospora TaxID=4868 RepID=A0ACC1JBS4_9FUNG|nr:hypothetical protein FBU59_002220 [Linderina macrospora]
MSDLFDVLDPWGNSNGNSTGGGASSGRGGAANAGLGAGLPGMSATPIRNCLGKQ